MNKKMEKLTKRKVYLPVRVEDEFPNRECVMISKTQDMLVGYPTNVNGEVQANNDHEILRHITHWLKEQDAFVLTPEQLNEYTANVIQKALETAAEKAELDYSGGNCRECGANKINEKSITDTFEETFKQFEV